jgi:hypothetical protein
LSAIFSEDISAELGANHEADEAEREHGERVQAIDSLRGNQAKNVAKEYSHDNTADHLRDVQSLRETRAQGPTQDN